MVKSLPANAGDTRHVQSFGWEDPLELEMATLCSILALKIPWTEETGRLQSMGFQRVRHNLFRNVEVKARGKAKRLERACF